MKPSTISNTVKTNLFIISGATILVALFFVSLFVGKFPLSINEMLGGNQLHIQVFLTLRLSRAFVGVLGGFALGLAGFVYQTVFRNPLASPDIIGVASGASAGAAAGILFFLGTFIVTICSFGGAVAAVLLALALASIDRTGKKSTVVLAGIAVHSLMQTILMFLKLSADPERQLASIEYWIMGSLNGINSHIIAPNTVICCVCLIALVLLHRQTILLSADEGEARMLGINVSVWRLILLMISTVTVACIVSMTGLISFVGLLAPHCARKLTGNNSIKTMVLGGIIGGVLLCGADILARSVASTELPVSIFTSLIGAPFLIVLLVRGKDNV